jgi:hypothetical protein
MEKIVDFLKGMFGRHGRLHFTSVSNAVFYQDTIRNNQLFQVSDNPIKQAKKSQTPQKTLHQNSIQTS